ncbi:MAG: class I SAM-dependent RNA methyltransferase [Betaproteobacteria bacterium]|nr:MAG: class I SAM-dependent RNA methyltransferase [Betaproteobacteria bacterium]TMG77547.1 MAG: class I SAM-dependent RNA methyltransferase [Betaproteobacteria bacterium]
MSPQAFFASCPRGLEALLADELREFGARNAERVAGGVAFEGDTGLCYRANLESRLATRVLMRLARAPCGSEQDVYDAALALRWPDWFSEKHSIRVDVNAIRSPLKSLEFATLRIKDAVCDRFRADRGRRPDVDTRSPGVRIQGFLDRASVTLYLDTSGEPLHKRGYRKDAGEAPLKENLAAGIVRLTGWDGSEPLLDPMCGSGTLAIEAAMMALAIPPGHARGFGFERLAGFDPRRWKEVREAALARAQAPRKLALFARDRYGEELKKARLNLEAAGLAPCVELKQADVLDTGAPAGAGVLVANPPYGARLGEDQALAEFYPKLGDTLKKFYAGWRCYFFSGDARLPKLIRLAASKRTPLFNGSLECRLYEYRIVAGSMRKERAG